MPALSPPTKTPDALSFDAIYTDCFDFVWSVLRRLGVSEAAIDDACQEVFLVVYRRLGDFEHRATVRTWVFSIARRVAADWRRKNQRHEEHEELSAEEVDPGATPFEQACGAESRDVVQRVLDRMDAPKREVFVLSEIFDLSGPEIAECLDLGLECVYTRLRTARQEFEKSARRMARLEELRPRARGTEPPAPGPTRADKKRVRQLLLPFIPFGVDRASAAGPGAATATAAAGGKTAALATALMCAGAILIASVVRPWAEDAEASPSFTGRESIATAEDREPIATAENRAPEAAEAAPSFDTPVLSQAEGRPAPAGRGSGRTVKDGPTAEEDGAAKSIAEHRAPKPTAKKRAPIPTTEDRAPIPTAEDRAPKPTAEHRAPEPTAEVAASFDTPVLSQAEGRPAPGRGSGRTVKDGPTPSPPALPSIADELRLLRAARRALLGGQVDRGADLLRTYARLFPSGQLRREAAALRILHHCRAGKTAAARAATASFSRTWGDSALDAAVVRGCPELSEKKTQKSQ